MQFTQEQINFLREKMDEMLSGAQSLPTTTKEKKPKVKRGRSAYIIWTMEKRGEIKESEPDLTFAEVSKKLGELWSGMSEEEKSVYKQKSDEEKVTMEAEASSTAM